MKKYFLYALYVIIGGGLLYGLLQVILAGYSASWTGFGEYTSATGDIVQSKKLWDWMELLIIPLVLAIGAFFLNRSERAVEREIALDRQREEALQTYLDRIAELLLKESLQTTESEEIRNVARVQTLTALRWLDSRRKRLILEFLEESGLLRLWRRSGSEEIIHRKFPAVDIHGANFSGVNLNSIILFHAKLMKTNFADANLEKAYLEGTDFTEAILTGANLSHAYFNGSPGMPATLSEAKLNKALLTEAFLYEVDLRGADLTGADLTNADLSDANLKSAKVTYEQLTTAKSLKGATMPDGTKHE